LTYLDRMPRRVYYQISDRPDGRFDAIVTIEPDTVIRRDGFDALAEVEEWVEGLRVLMAALGAPVAQAEPAGAPSTTGNGPVADAPDGPPRAGRVRSER
jgi:hypothetical protein